MGVFKNDKNGTWFVQFRYTDWKGERQQKFKRGFATKREAQDWEREFLMKKQADVTMLFSAYAELYERDIKPRLKENTWLTKESIIQKKIVPYFGKRKLCDITAKDVIEWQNEIRNLTDKGGKSYSSTYLKTVHNQLSAIDDRMEDGIPEETAVSEIGTVDDIVSQIIADIPLGKLVKEKIKPKKKLKAWEIILLVLGSPLWLSLLIAAFAVFLSLYVVFWSVIISLWAVFASFVACGFAGVVAGAVFAAGGNGLTGIAVIAAGIVCAGLSAFMFFGCKAATKGILKLTKKFAIWIKNCFIKKEEA